MDRELNKQKEWLFRVLGPKKKSVGEWTEKELRALPRRDWQQDIDPFDSIVVLPRKPGFVDYLVKLVPKWTREFKIKGVPLWKYSESHIHDSGYRLIDFVAVEKAIPFCRLGGNADVCHFEGIGAFGLRWKAEGDLAGARATRWNFDCLPTSGLLHIWNDDGKLCAGPNLSSFELYVVEKPKEGERTVHGQPF